MRPLHLIASLCFGVGLLTSGVVSATGGREATHQTPSSAHSPVPMVNPRNFQRIAQGRRYRLISRRVDQHGRTAATHLRRSTEHGVVHSITYRAPGGRMLSIEIGASNDPEGPMNMHSLTGGPYSAASTEDGFPAARYKVLAHELGTEDYFARDARGRWRSLETGRYASRDQVFPKVFQQRAKSRLARVELDVDVPGYPSEFAPQEHYVTTYGPPSSHGRVVAEWTGVQNGVKGTKTTLYRHDTPVSTRFDPIARR